jgi:hypothetical protein
MKNPGIFIAAPVSTTARDLAALRRTLSHIALGLGFQAYRGNRGSVFALLAAIASGKVKIERPNKRT